ncbi:hypothetical protein BP6252_12286 [Coleophoma cylindrospora]|uniref:Uncharacterized protein n=1 Tax=Coleophoma cylindrospora TaxID=1849047 RepID=A0A3D8QGE4_9HELO|nr:hypothetical protein BP6252_12286 [Coleophoma cylindrospora]
MDSKSYNGPPASKLVLLSDLGRTSPGQKVRFLGCVSGYSRNSIPATMVLRHDFPNTRSTSLEALVDVDLLLSSLKPTDTQYGEWVHVIGYVKDDIPAGSHKVPGATTPQVSIQALVLWSAGPFSLDEYESTLTRQKLLKDC